MTTEPRTIYLLRVAAPSGAAGIRALRALLKELLRRHQFICIDAREEHGAAAGVTATEEETRSSTASAQPADEIVCAPSIREPT